MIKNKVVDIQKIRNSKNTLVGRDMRAWKALAGIWSKKALEDVVQWQRKMRKEWERS